MLSKVGILSDVVNEILDLQEGKELLERLFIEIGPYKDGKISYELWNKVRDYFNFDDSE